MDKRELIYIIIAVLGWSWGVLQFFLKRKIVKKDKIVDRRFDAYSTYLKKSDELMNNVRTDPNMIYGIFPELFKGIVSGDSNAADNALSEFNTKLFDIVKKASEPLLILNQELRALQLVCSVELMPKIEELRKLSSDFNKEVTGILNTISSNKNEKDKASHYQTFSADERWKRFESLNNEILKLMRKEIGNK